MIKIIIFGSLTTYAAYSVAYTYHHTEITVLHEDEYLEVYTRLTPTIQQMATGSLGVDNPAEWTYHLS